MAKLTGVQALTVDTFGTVVDWYTPVFNTLADMGRHKHVRNVDWDIFTREWRGGYKPATAAVNRGESGVWARLSDLNRSMLDQLLTSHGIETLSESEKEELNNVWQRLDAWPDSSSGIERLRKKFTVAALSNGSIEPLAKLSKSAGVQWDAILSVDIVQRYKPDPAVYEMAANLLNLPSEQILMVAAHKEDLRAAKSSGFKTAHVLRPMEWGPSQASSDAEPDSDFDITASDFKDLAHQLGV